MNDDLFAEAVAQATALGHAPLLPREAFTASGQCTACGALASLTVDGWTGWAVEQSCERVQRVAPTATFSG